MKLIAIETHAPYITEGKVYECHRVGGDEVVLDFDDLGKFGTQLFARRFKDVADMRDAPTAASPLTTQVGGSHYKGLAIQPAEYNHANGIPFMEGNVIKYVTRWRSKGGIADLNKAAHMIALLIELESKKV